jgi:FkbM family methyltransferase
MHLLERTAVAVRRSCVLGELDPLWTAVRPVYRRFLRSIGRSGLERNMNGTDRILVAPELYTLNEVYEPEVWPAILGEARPGDVVIDIGACLGLYTVALARRVGPAGRVYAFEPDPVNTNMLTRQVQLNRVASTTTIIPCAVGDHVSEVCFTMGRGSESHVGAGPGGKTVRVQLLTIDTVLPDSRVDLMKIDVEGFEECVLRGAARLLSDRKRSPRVIFVEVHPFAWARFGVTGDSLIRALSEHGYSLFDLQGRRVDQVAEHGEVVARRESRDPSE